MQSPSRFLGVLGIFVLTPTAGCSLVFVEPPPKVAEGSRPAPVDCTTSKAAPALDSIAAGLEVVRMAYAASADDKDYKDFPISREADIALGLTFATLFAGSAIYGYTKTSTCRKTKHAFEIAGATVMPAAPPPSASEPHAAPPAASAVLE